MSALAWLTELSAAHGTRSRASRYRSTVHQSTSAAAEFRVAALSFQALTEETNCLVALFASSASDVPPGGRSCSRCTSGHRSTRANGRRDFHQLSQQDGMPRIRFHDLRHSTVTLPVQAGVGLKTVSAVLGHSQLSGTADYYAHITSALTAPALARLSQVLQP